MDEVPSPPASASLVSLKSCKTWWSAVFTLFLAFAESMLSSPSSAASKGKWENLPPAGQCLQGAGTPSQFNGIISAPQSHRYLIPSHCEGQLGWHIADMD